MSAMGVKINQFNLPVCTSFQAKVLNDQLCYEVDLSRYSDKDNIDNELTWGFNFIMDYNEDRQINSNKDIIKIDREKGLATSVIESDIDQHAFIYLNTIGEKKYKI